MKTMKNQFITHALCMLQVPIFFPILSGLLTLSCFVGDGLRCYAQAQPDLTLANGKFTYTPSTHEINITIDVKNIGSGDVGFGSGARVGCFLSTDAVVSSDDYLITNFGFSYGIFANACYCGSSTGNIDLTITQAPAGTYKVLVKADDTNVITESNENNNAADLGIINYGAATAVNDFAGYTGNTTALVQNYPNPVVSNTSFSFFVHEQGYISLKIYDVQGKEISTVVNQDLKAGAYKYEFNRKDIPTGIYYYTLTSGKNTQTKKLVITNRRTDE